MSGEIEVIASTKEKIDAVSPSFCLAKWLQVTIHLHNGRTHSCHHPSTHHIPIKEIQEDPGALHNTKFKQEQQQKMINGERPPECQYCWNVEDLPGNYTSDRYMKSNDRGWAGDEMIPIVAEKARNGEKVNPTYVEVNFSNVCNFKCGYCSPQYSSKWVSEVENHGPYILKSHPYNDIEYMKQHQTFPIHHKAENPYVDAFWKWWPEIRNDLRVFRVTGGEPFLDKNTFRVMDELYENPNPEMELSFNSNLGVPDEVIDKYIEKINPLIEEGKIRRSILYTSVDAHGPQAEYGRHGLNYEKWLANLDKVLTEVPKLKVTIMCTTNILSITSFDRLLKDVYDLKIKHHSMDRDMALTIDISILRWPAHYNASILPPEYAKLMDGCLDYMLERQEGVNGNPFHQGFYIFEIEKMRRFIATVQQPVNKSEGINVAVAMRDFRLFVDEHDRRRGTNFLKTFPELEEFYNDCGS